MHLLEAFIQAKHYTQCTVYILSLHEFPVNQTQDLGIAYATEHKEHIIQSKCLI